MKKRLTIRGYYLTFAEQWDDPTAMLTLRRETPGRNRRVRVLLRVPWKRGDE